MPEFTIEIEATILASIEVEAKNVDEAIVIAKEEIYADGYEIKDFTCTHIYET